MHVCMYIVFYYFKGVLAMTPIKRNISFYHNAQVVNIKGVSIVGK